MAMQGREPFIGATPPALLAQIIGLVDLDTWKSAWIAGSSIFTIERALTKRCPALALHGNDVSIASAAIAALARDETLDFTFTGKLAKWEQLLAGRPFLDRVAALMLCKMLAAQFPGESLHSLKHWAHYERDFDASIERPRERAAALVAELRLASYTGGDFRDHLARCAEAGGGFIIASPPTRSQHDGDNKFIAANVSWNQPKFEGWSPAGLPALLDQLDTLGLPFIALADAPIDDRNVASLYRKGLDPARYVLTSERTARTSLIDQPPVTDAKPFKFVPVDIDRISKRTQVRLYPCSAGSADYVKALFLQENIVFVRGMVNVLIYLDDMLAGVLTYNRMNRALGGFKQHDAIYLLSDVSTSRFGRISKLLPMLATCRHMVDYAGRRLTHRPVLQVLTTVRTNNPASMKYRGVFNMVARKEAAEGESSGSRYIINYGSAPREQTPQQIFREWLRLYFKDDRDRRVTNSHAARADAD